MIFTNSLSRQINKEAALRKILAEIMNCKKCSLWKTRTNPVIGEGDPNAEIVFIGEAPGKQEDLQGRPFVGAAGKILTELIESVLGIPRNSVYITNVLKCRPPNNRDPKPEEIMACSPYLDRQLAIIKPRYIICLGRFSAAYILGKAGVKFKSILKIRRKTFIVDFGSFKSTVIATIHPAAALYKPDWRKIIYSDFEYIRDVIRGVKKEPYSTLDSFFG